MVRESSAHPRIAPAHNNAARFTEKGEDEAVV